MNLTNNITATYNQTNETKVLWVSDSDWMKHGDFLERLNLGQKIISILITIFTILGNMLVLIATWREKNLHQPSKYFIACLAVADLLVGLFLAPRKLYDLDPNIKSRFSISIYFCRFMVWIDFFALATSIHTLTFISFDRYLKISKPLHYKSRMTTSRSLKIIFVIAFISISLATYSTSPHSASDGLLSVGYSFCKSGADYKKSKPFFLSLLIIWILLPTTIILVMYALIFCVAHRRNKMILNGELGRQTFSNQNQRNALRKDVKVIRMLMVVVGAFIFCWYPLFIWSWLHFYHSNLVSFKRVSASTHNYRVLIRYLVSTLPLVNSLCNPIIYACFDQTYREAFKHLFQRMMCRPDLGRQQLPIELRPPRTR